ncbi:hypothetical protein O181_014593 [Austropuccinia psidii MF-1]|uniref:Uncharacterized protein n=1 Tax=Austropuccinia psidii MF-1 TaxID=1389203 RepID=A0A9Q3GP64_9BASI|nr:hypothetical protein [Austropuccinia psidii MF-1]
MGRSLSQLMVLTAFLVFGKSLGLPPPVNPTEGGSCSAGLNEGKRAFKHTPQQPKNLGEGSIRPLAEELSEERPVDNKEESPSNKHAHNPPKLNSLAKEFTPSSQGRNENSIHMAQVPPSSFTHHATHSPVLISSSLEPVGAYNNFQPHALTPNLGHYPVSVNPTNLDASPLSPFMNTGLNSVPQGGQPDLAGYAVLKSVVPGVALVARQFHLPITVHSHEPALFHTDWLVPISRPSSEVAQFPNSINQVGTTSASTKNHSQSQRPPFHIKQRQEVKNNKKPYSRGLAVKNPTKTHKANNNNLLFKTLSHGPETPLAQYGPEQKGFTDLLSRNEMYPTCQQRTELMEGENVSQNAAQEIKSHMSMEKQNGGMKNLPNTRLQAVDVDEHSKSIRQLKLKSTQKVNFYNSQNPPKKENLQPALPIVLNPPGNDISHYPAPEVEKSANEEKTLSQRRCEKVLPATKPIGPYNPDSGKFLTTGIYELDRHSSGKHLEVIQDQSPQEKIENDARKTPPEARYEKDNDSIEPASVQGHNLSIIGKPTLTDISSKGKVVQAISKTSKDSAVKKIESSKQPGSTAEFPHSIQGPHSAYETLHFTNTVTGVLPIGHQKDHGGKGERVLSCASLFKGHETENSPPPHENWASLLNRKHAIDKGVRAKEHVKISPMFADPQSTSTLGSIVSASKDLQTDDSRAINIAKEKENKPKDNKSDEKKTTSLQNFDMTDLVDESSKDTLAQPNQHNQNSDSFPSTCTITDVFSKEEDVNVSRESTEASRKVFQKHVIVKKTRKGEKGKKKKTHSAAPKAFSPDSPKENANENEPPHFRELVQNPNKVDFEGRPVPSSRIEKTHHQGPLLGAELK